MKLVPVFVPFRLAGPKGLDIGWFRLDAKVYADAAALVEARSAYRNVGCITGTHQGGMCSSPLPTLRPKVTEHHRVSPDLIQMFTGQMA